MKLRRMVLGMGTLATILPATFAFSRPAARGLRSHLRARMPQLSTLETACRGHRRTIASFSLGTNCARADCLRARLLWPFSSGAGFSRSLSLHGSPPAGSDPETDDDYDRVDHNEMIIDAMEEGAADFERLKSVVEVAFEAPSKWWDEVVARRLDRIAESAALTPGKRVLDIGTGTGTMVEYLSAPGRAYQKDVVGVDLSATLLNIASKRYPEATFVQGDILDMELDDLQPDQPDASAAPSGGDSPASAADSPPPPPPPPFDAVVLNAAFSILFDPEATLRRAAELLGRDGRLVISHPIGAAFVDRLRAEDPVFAAHALPRTRDALERLIAFAPLALRQEIVDEEELYIAVLERTPHRALEEVLLLQGPVATGYGRGGKKLGVPTANLPERLLSDALAAVPLGVYLGWAVVDGAGPAARAVPAVVNIGYSPTFVGEENRERVVEAHLLADMGGDFYGRQMRLLLAGFQRPERRFPSFPALLAAIRQDVDDARAALAAAPFAALAGHPFLAPGGGRGAAPWARVPWARAVEAAALLGGGGRPAA